MVFLPLYPPCPPPRDIIVSFCINLTFSFSPGGICVATPVLPQPVSPTACLSSGCQGTEALGSCSVPQCCLVYGTPCTSPHSRVGDRLCSCCLLKTRCLTVSEMARLGGLFWHREVSGTVEQRAQGLCVCLRTGVTLLSFPLEHN